MLSKLIKSTHFAIRTALVTSLFAVSTVNAAGQEDFISEQMAISDGSPYVEAFRSEGRAGRAGNPVAVSAQDLWLQQQLAISDGSPFSIVESATAEGSGGLVVYNGGHDTFLDRALSMSDGNN